MTARSLLAALAAALSVTAAAQSDTIASRKVVTRVTAVAIGHTDILDTYLSPERYRGTDVRFISHVTREPDGRHWSCQLVHQGNVAFADNRAGEGGEIAGAYLFSYGWHRRWDFLSGRLRLKAGATADALLGFVYNTRNGNNPAQARASLSVCPSAIADYRFCVSRLPLTARYEVSAPLAGLMFSPNYGQSYYEIFSRGNYDHNVVPTTFVSTPSLRQSLTVDVPLLGVTWRVGYLGEIQQARVNGLRQHFYTHALMVGVVKRFKTLKIRP